MATVQAEHVWKRFFLQKDRADSVGQLLVRMLPGRGRRPKAEPFWALQDVSFEMLPGTSLGIVGSNGSGKSTMLKLLTGTMLPTSGQVAVNGRVSALIELGAGFHPDFSGRENIVLSASILGYRRREIEGQMESIIEFSGIRSFIDSPVKYYSSGMNARLGFSVAIHVHPEILIVDEVLAVGDEAFNQKCMERIFQMKRSGVSILLVSHDLGSIERLMDRAVWIEKGVLRSEGKPRDVVHDYRSYLQGIPATISGSDNSVQDMAEGLALTGQIMVAGRPMDVVASGDAIDLVLRFENHFDVMMRGHLVMSVRRPDGLEIAQFSTSTDGQTVHLPHGGSVIMLSFYDAHLSQGTYEIDAAFTLEDGRRLPAWKPLLRFRVQSAEGREGLILVPHRWALPCEDSVGPAIGCGS